MDEQNKYIILCILATEINNDNQSTESHTIHFAERTWKLIDALAQYKQEFQTEIDKCESRQIRFSILKPSLPDGTCELAITYRRILAKTSQKDLALATTLFPLLFVDYQIDIEQQIGYRTQDHLDKVYVTSELYSKVNERHQTISKQCTKADENTIVAKLPDLFQPDLRGYQCRTVAWLLQRETSSDDKIPSNYQQMQSVDGTTIVYKHKICLCFITKEEAMRLTQDFILPPGGILADEMGLGKTVEMLALILLHPRSEIKNNWLLNTMDDFKDSRALKRICLSNDVFCICTSKSKISTIQCLKCNLWQHTKCVNVFKSINTKYDSDDNHLCAQCWMDITQVQLIESGATFIVSPNTIKTQWLSEIERHTKPSLRVFNYLGNNSGQYISPFDLAQYDVVLTDYNVLRYEIYHTDKYRSDRKTRRPPAFMRYTSPLLMINWWRVCLDEAQMVESNTSNAAELAHMLVAINRWAVTGTPIQRSIHDLHPLLRFLGFYEFCEPQNAWNALVNSFLLEHDTNQLIDVLQKSLWRTSKANVQQELELPPQTEEIHRMQLSNIEMLHYREQHASCTVMFLENLERYVEDNEQASSLTKISPTLLKLILQPLLKIRQCCTMPVLQTGMGKKHLSNNKAQKQFVNPKELLLYMKNSNEQECTTQLRTWASSYNGIAAIFFIRKEYDEAIKQYELVLRLAKEYKEKSISVDKLLQIHALHNIIQANVLADPKILNEHCLANYTTDLSTLEWKYLSPYMEVLTNARMAYKTSFEQYLRLESQTNLNLIEFVSALIENCGHVEEALCTKIKDECLAHSINNSKIQELSSMWGILLVIEVWYKKISKLKENLCAEFEQLSFFTETATKQDELASIRSDVQGFVLTVSDCHLSYILDDEVQKKKQPKKIKKTLCKLCNIRRIINEFECLLFAKELDEETEATDGSETPAFEILLIKFIFNFLKTKSDFLEYQDLFIKHWESLECLQSICKKQIKYWIEIEYTVKAFDELDMCKMRISLANKEEEKSNFRVMSYELDNLEAEQQANLQEAQLKFTRLEGRLKYLNHLSQENSDINCPICQTDDDDRYGVLECGHLVCDTCLGIVMRFKKDKTPQCPICRSVSNQVYYALKKPVTSAQNVIGNHSSKVAYIVETVLGLLNENSEVSPKILIFSQWEAILKAISIALIENNVKNRLNCTPRSIEEFKDPARKITCMLMPIARGSKGLNLIEATHVFLVEPILNPGEELQAVGRIHRFGQTKPTTVHRFIVKNTIEENIYNFITAARCAENKSASNHWQLESMTWQNIKDLFILDDTSL